MKIKGLHIYNNDTFVEPCVANIYDVKQQFSAATDLEDVTAEEVILAVVEDLQVSTKKPGANPTDMHQLISVVEEEDQLVSDVVLDNVSKRICGYTSLTELANELRDFDSRIKQWQDRARQEEADRVIEELGITMTQLISQKLDLLEIGSFANYDEYRLFCRKVLAASIKHMSNFLLDIS